MASVRTGPICSEWQGINQSSSTKCDFKNVKYIIYCCQHYFEIKLNGVRKWRAENINPRTYNSVKVWAAKARHGYPPADANIRNLVHGMLFYAEDSIAVQCMSFWIMLVFVSRSLPGFFFKASVKGFFLLNPPLLGSFPYLSLFDLEGFPYLIKSIYICKMEAFNKKSHFIQ